MISERDLISRIRLADMYKSHQVVKGIGDDCAVFRSSGQDQSQLSLVSTDTLMEGIHFDLGWHPPELLGRKAAAVNISDIAAMGGNPTLALLSLAVPSATDSNFLDLLLKGFLAVLDEHKVTLVGGDTVKSNNDLALSVTVFGEVEEKNLLCRTGAAVGDLVWVSGCLGQAAMGLEICRKRDDQLQLSWPDLVSAHLNPIPEVELGKMLAESGQVTAMMDMSDGLATDLAHLCKENGLGAQIDSHLLPLSDELHKAAAALQLKAIDLAVTGGEDYGLLFTTHATARQTIQKVAKENLGQQLFCVGEIVENSGVGFQKDGIINMIDFKGFDHFA